MWFSKEVEEEEHDDGCDGAHQAGEEDRSQLGGGASWPLQRVGNARANGKSDRDQHDLTGCPIGNLKRRPRGLLRHQSPIPPNAHGFDVGRLAPDEEVEEPTHSRKRHRCLSPSELLPCTKGEQIERPRRVDSSR